MLQQWTITRAQLSEPPWVNTHRQTAKIFRQQPFVNCRVCVYVCPQVILLHRTVPVSHTEEPFVFQSQPVKTRGCWREEEMKITKKEGWDSDEVEDTCNRNTIYIEPFTTKVRQCVAGRNKTSDIMTKEQKKVCGFERWEERGEDKSDDCHHYSRYQPHDSVIVRDPSTFIV